MIVLLVVAIIVFLYSFYVLLFPEKF
ncbi:potassium-transporting ATPase subunit F [Sphingobacterium kyonggiense]